MAATTRRPYHRSENLVWVVASLSWVAMTQPGGGGGVGDASAANQVTGNASLASIDGKTPALGQALAASSVPVILPAATVTTLTPPAAITGFATSANQTTELSSLSSIDGKTPALGQALAAGSVPVILPSATISTLTPPAAITGFATTAKQDTGNSSLSSIDGKVPALGQALAASSVPVILPSATISTLTPLATLTAVTTITNPISSKTDLTPSVPTVATVGVASGSAVSAQATRKGLVLRNLSTTGQRISLGFGQTAVLDSGVTLYPQDAYEMGEYDFDLGAVNAIASAASASLAIQEFLT